MKVKKSNRYKWKEEKMDGIKKHGLYSFVFRGSSVLMVNILVILITMLVKTRKIKRSQIVRFIQRIKSLMWL